MQALSVLVLLLAGSADEHVRSLDPWAAEAVRIGAERSQTVRDLMAELEESDVIVHIETRLVLPLGAAGTTRLAAVTASHRYVRIVLFRDPLPVNRVVVLGHELQHAWEIARSTVRDAHGMRALFDVIGRPSPGERTAYETEAAIKVGRLVWYELRGDARNAARVKQDVAELLSGRDHFE
jgi:hypothetical protein